MQWLDAAMHPLGPVSTPHPMRVRQGVITDGHLIATWLDRELMLACMGAILVGGTAENGEQRSELRTSIGSRTIHYPAGHAWAHALDAEPMALATNGDIVVFDLYRRGLVWNWNQRRRTLANAAPHLVVSQTTTEKRGNSRRPHRR